MALLFVESFDGYATADIPYAWTATSGAPAIASGGRTDNGLVMNAVVESVQATAIGGVSEVVIGVAVKIAAFPNDGWRYAILTVGSAVYWEAALAINPDGTFQTCTSDATTNNMSPGSPYYLTPVGAATSVSVTVDEWTYLEWKIKVHGTTGSSVVRLNGVEQLNATGIDTLTSSTTLTRVGLGGSGTGGATATTVTFDDLYVASTSGGSVTDFLGDVTVEHLHPQTDAVDAGTNAGWTCSTGSDHGALVDDATPDGDTTYVSADTNVKDTWNYPDLSVANATIHGVQVRTLARKTATGTAQFKNLARPTTTDNQGATTHAPSATTYAYYRDIWEKNADDGVSDWLVSDINGAEFGVERTA